MDDVAEMLCKDDEGATVEVETAVERAQAARTRRLLRALEAHRARCAAAGEVPAEEDNWLVLLAALHAAGD